MEIKDSHAKLKRKSHTQGDIMPKTVWDDMIIFKAYELSRSGMSQVKIAKALGIHIETLRTWKRKKKLFRMSLGLGHRSFKKKSGDVVTFQDYMFGHLSPEAKIAWDKIHVLNRRKSGVEKIKAVFERHSIRVRQMLFLHAWTCSNFCASIAMKKLGMSLDTFRNWQKDPEFCTLVQEIDWHKKNFLEDYLFRLIKDGDTSATIFANQTLNKDRGYGKTVKHEQDVTVNVNVVSIEGLGLPLDVRRQILSAIQKNTAIIDSNDMLQLPGHVTVYPNRVEQTVP